MWSIEIAIRFLKILIDNFISSNYFLSVDAGNIMDYKINMLQDPTPSNNESLMVNYTSANNIRGVATFKKKWYILDSLKNLNSIILTIICMYYL